MRLITKKGISDSIMNYNALVKGVNVQGQYYNEQFKKTFDYSLNLFDFTYARTPLQEDFKFKQLNDFKTTKFKLVSADELTRKRYVSNVIMLQTIIGTYVFDLKFAADYETRFIALLKKKYGNE